MKLGKLFLVGAIALGLGLTACNNDAPDVENEKAGALTLTVVQGAPSTRLVGNISSEGASKPVLMAESKIHTIEVWVFSGGILERYYSGPLAGDKIQVAGLTVGEKEIVVVANAALGTQPDKTTLLAKTKELSQDITNGLVMTAEPFTQTLTACEEPDCNAAEVTITRVNARVALTCLEVDFGTGLPYNNFKLSEIAIFNVPKTTKLFGAPLVSAPLDFFYGSAYPSSVSSYVGSTGDPSGKNGAVNGDLAEANDQENPFVYVTNAPYFYVHENDAAQQTFIVLKGTLWSGDTQYTLPGVFTDHNGFTYYRIDVNLDNPDYSFVGTTAKDGKLLRNNLYNICVTLKKAGNPTIDEPETTCLDVTVTVKDWEVVTQNVNWGQNPDV